MQINFVFGSPGAEIIYVQEVLIQIIVPYTIRNGSILLIQTVQGRLEEGVLCLNKPCRRPVQGPMVLISTEKQWQMV